LFYGSWQAVKLQFFQHLSVCLAQCSIALLTFHCYVLEEYWNNAAGFWYGAVFYSKEQNSFDEVLCFMSIVLLVAFHGQEFSLI